MATATDKGEVSLDELNRRLKEIRARREEIERFVTPSMKERYLAWNTNDIERLEAQIKLLERSGSSK